MKHFDPEILARLYGSSTEISVSSPSLSGSNLGVAGSLKESIVIEFTTNVEELLPNIRKKARKGHWEAALKEIEELIALPRWQMLDAVLRSRVLVLSASLNSYLLGAGTGGGARRKFYGNHWFHAFVKVFETCSICALWDSIFGCIWIP